MTDFSLINHGSLYTLIPQTDAAKEWVAEYIPEDAMGWAGGVVIEPRYVADIVDGLTNDGLTI